MTAQVTAICNELVTTLGGTFTGLTWSKSDRPRLDSESLLTPQAYVVPTGIATSRASRGKNIKTFTIAIFVAFLIENTTTSEGVTTASVDQGEEWTEDILDFVPNLRLTTGKVVENGITVTLNDNEAIQMEARFTSMITIEFTNQVVSV